MKKNLKICNVGFQKTTFSFITVILIALMMFSVRVGTLLNQKPIDVKVTTWDCFGYYMYLPAVFIYQDYEKLNWVAKIDTQYRLTGGDFYQARQVKNGNQVGKYFVGIAVMQAPFFAIGHLWASFSAFPADGFSYPYQVGIAFAPVFYCFLALLFLRSVLRRFFNEKITGLSLIGVFLATNAIQYIAVEGGQSHGYIFLLYALILYLTIKWHENPRLHFALMGGLVLGLGILCRPTEFIMAFIPLFWNTHTQSASKVKWQQVRSNKIHVLLAAVGAMIAILPQLLYWQMVTGSLVYNIGSKWYFLNPFFRVLFGWEKGWFVYTPITVLFVLGFLFLKKYPFRKSVLVFCLLNLWIIMAWSDWRYGGSYSARALVQGYPVFALAFAALLEKVLVNKWQWIAITLIAYLTLTNLFQTWQYNQGIIHFNDMNRPYYQHVYWNPSPSPQGMSYMDGGLELPTHISPSETGLFSIQDSLLRGQVPLFVKELDTKISWVGVHIEGRILSEYWNGGVAADFGQNSKAYTFRFANAISKDTALNSYVFFLPKPDSINQLSLKFYPESASMYIKSLSVNIYHDL